MSIKLPKIFLDSGNPDETRRAKGLLGFLDGQTTNPSLVAKHPEVLDKKLKEEDLLKFYKDIVVEIEKEISGPISVEVYSDWESTAETMLKQAENMFNWGKHIQVKFPTTQEGVKASLAFLKNEGRVNMTLVFDQIQAAAVYTLSQQTEKPTFCSPFLGRWDDRGCNGLDLLKNIIKMYRKFDKKTNSKTGVKVLASSIRTLEHLYGSIFLGADMITIPFKLIEEWVRNERFIPGENYRIQNNGLKSMVYSDVPFLSDPLQYEIKKVDGDLLDEGLKKFATDWKSLILL